jgi:predicted dehydrogenase
MKDGPEPEGKMDHSLNRRGFLGTIGAAGLTLAMNRRTEGQASETKKVRLGVIGVGNRGTYLLRLALSDSGIEVPALCDIKPNHLQRAIKLVRNSKGNIPTGYDKGPEDFRRMLGEEKLDAVIIATPVVWHTAMSVAAMKEGIVPGSEVSAATNMEECWELVEKNANYRRENMMILNLVRQGYFGRLTNAVCGYLHDCRYLRFNPDGSLTWRGESALTQTGNTYPTHSLGPVCHWMDINRGDRMVSMVSMNTPSLALKAYAAEKFGPDSKQAEADYKAADCNVSLIKTDRGNVITVFYSSNAPFPHTLPYRLQGTKGAYEAVAGKIYIEGRETEHRWGDVQDYLTEFDHKVWAEHKTEAEQTGHGGADFFVVAELLDAVRNKRAPAVDVYDAAAWSSITPLSQESITKGNQPIEIPDFTRGAWKNRT